MLILIKSPTQQLRTAIHCGYPNHEFYSMSSGICCNCHHVTEDPFTHKYTVIFTTPYTKTSLTFTYEDCKGIEIRKGGL